MSSKKLKINNKTTQLIDFIKSFFHKKRDGDVAEMLGITQTALYNHKLRGTIPYKKLIPFCIKHNISLDEVFGLKEDSRLRRVAEETKFKIQDSNMAVAEDQAIYESLPPRLRALCDKLKQIYSEGNVDDKAKVMGIIEAVHDEVERKKESRFPGAQEGESGTSEENKEKRRSA